MLTDVRLVYQDLMINDLQTTFPRLFFLLQKMTIKWEKDDFPAAAAVSFDKNTRRINLHIKHGFLSRLPHTQAKQILKSVLIHEIGHLVYSHLFMYDKSMKKSELRLLNVAQDLYLNHRSSVVIENLNAINEQIRRNKEKAEVLTKKYEPLFEEANKKGDLEAFMKLSEEYKKEMGGGHEGASTIEEFWANSCLFPHYEEDFKKHGINFEAFMELDSFRIYHILKREEDKRKEEKKKQFEKMLSEMTDEQLEQFMENMQGSGSFDSHEGLDINDLDVANEIKQKLKQAQKDFKRSGKKAGTGEGDMAKIFDEVLSTKTNWHEVLEHFVATVTLDEKIRTWTRSNRRYPNQTPGRKKDHIPSVVFGIDLSGSMVDDNTLGMIKNQLKQLLHSCENVWVVGGDTRETFRILLESPEQVDNLQFIGGGGTDLQFIWEAAQELKVDGVVCQTDGYLFGQVEDYNIPSMFFIYPGGQEWEPTKYKNILISNCI